MERERWATFDCYGTLIDWNGGVVRELERLFGVAEAPALLARYHVVEPEVQARRSARELPHRHDRGHAAARRARGRRRKARGVAARLERVPGGARGSGEGLERTAGSWRSSPTPTATSSTRRSSGSACPSTSAIVASEIGSYKPAPGHWRAFEREVGRLPDVHVGASLFHDIATANELGIPSVWVNRLGERADPEPTREIRDLAPLAGVLGELVPA